MRRKDRYVIDFLKFCLDPRIDRYLNGFRDMARSSADRINILK